MQIDFFTRTYDDDAHEILHEVRSLRGQTNVPPVGVILNFENDGENVVYRVVSSCWFYPASSTGTPRVDVEITLDDTFYAPLGKVFPDGKVV
jgi:hypothetical protein